MRLRPGLVAIFAVLAILCRLSLCDAAQREVIVVQGAEIKPFADAVEGFEESCGCVLREIITLSPDSPDVAAHIRSLRPDGVLAVGTAALMRLQSLGSIPIFYTMGASLPQAFHSAQNISGVNMLVSPERHAEGILQILPHVKRVGLIYDPDNTGPFVDRLVRSFHSHSVQVIAKKVRSSGDAPRMLEDMKDKVDALLMLPDMTVTTPEMVNVMLMFSFRNSIPVIAFSEKYVRMGALAAITVGPHTLGVQTGEMARAHFAGKTGHRQIYNYSKKSIMIINMTIARKLGVNVRDSVLRKSIKVE